MAPTHFALLLATAGLFADDAPGQVSSTLPVYSPTAIGAQQPGRIEFDLDGGSSGQVYWLIVGLPGTGQDHFLLTLQREKNEGPVRALPSDRGSASEIWQRTTASRRQEMRRRRMVEPVMEYAASKFPDRRSFHLFVQESDILDDSGYREVDARLAACGERCLIYVDVDDWSEEFLNSTVQETARLFDEVVFPKARRLFGSHLDVDRNGKFTILFTHWLGKLSGGKVSLGGFVRGADFYRDVDPPLSNRCDMLYLNSNLKPGANLQSLLAHEYTHAITFSEHVFGHYLNGARPCDDEAWLSEAIAHLAENLIGKGYSNLDHRVSAYLTSPEKYRLVVPDYYRAGLWRCHGCRGATYLFLRWVVDRYGTETLRELSQSNLSGIENIEAATQTPFAELFRQWNASVALAGIDPAHREHDYRTLDLRGRLESRQLAGVRVRELPRQTSRWTIASTGMMPFEVRLSAGQTDRLAIEAARESGLQATLIRMPEDLPFVELAVSPAPPASPDARPVHLQVRQRSGAEVRWTNVAWELAYPPQVKIPELQTSATILACPEVFAAQDTKVGQLLLSDPIDLSKHGERSVVVKLTGVDSRNRRVAAWAIAPASKSDQPEGAATAD